MTDQIPVAEKTVEAPAPVKVEVEKYPAMQFVVKFAKLLATVIAVLFLLFALISIVNGIFSENGSFLWGLVNAGFYIMIGGVLVGLVKGMGEAFEVLLELGKRK